MCKIMVMKYNKVIDGRVVECSLIWCGHKCSTMECVGYRVRYEMHSTRLDYIYHSSSSRELNYILKRKFGEYACKLRSSKEEIGIKRTISFTFSKLGL